MTKRAGQNQIFNRLGRAGHKHRVYGQFSDKGVTFLDKLDIFIFSNVWLSIVFHHVFAIDFGDIDMVAAPGF